MVALKTCVPLLILTLLLPNNPLQNDFPDDFAVAVRDTRLFDSMEPYAEILAKVETGQYFPAESVVVDPYGIQWAEVRVGADQTGFLSDVIVLREKEKDLKKLLKRIDFSDIGLWDSEDLHSVQQRSIEIGFNITQLLFAQGLPLRERSKQGFEEWIYPRLVVLVENNMVVGYTDVVSLPRDRNIVIDLNVGDPEFSAVSGQWQDVSLTNSIYKLAVTGTESGRFDFDVPVNGAYRVATKWNASADQSAHVHYSLLQGDEEIAVFQGNQRLFSQKWVLLGEVKLKANNPLAIVFSAEDSKPFVVETVRIEYVNYHWNSSSGSIEEADFKDPDKEDEDAG